MFPQITSYKSPNDATALSQFHEKREWIDDDSAYGIHVSVFWPISGSFQSGYDGGSREPPGRSRDVTAKRQADVLTSGRATNHRECYEVNYDPNSAKETNLASAVAIGSAMAGETDGTPAGQVLGAVIAAAVLAHLDSPVTASVTWPAGIPAWLLVKVAMVRSLGSGLHPATNNLPWNLDDILWPVC